MPTSADRGPRAHVSDRMEWPVVDDLRVVFLLGPLVTVDDQVNVGEVDVQSVVMPLVVADLMKNEVTKIKILITNINI